MPRYKLADFQSTLINELYILPSKSKKSHQDLGLLVIKMQSTRHILLSDKRYKPFINSFPNVLQTSRSLNWCFMKAFGPLASSCSSGVANMMSSTQMSYTTDWRPSDNPDPCVTTERRGFVQNNEGHISMEVWKHSSNLELHAMYQGNADLSQSRTYMCSFCYWGSKFLVIPS